MKLVVCTIAQIFIAPKAGSPMQEIEEAKLLAYQGIEGDRYYFKAGTWPQNKPRSITFIAMDAIRQANEIEPYSYFCPEDTRRNIILDGITPEQLNDFVGRFFMASGVFFRGTEQCTPCNWPSQKSSKEGFQSRFQARGGIRAEILTEIGYLRPKDVVMSTLHSAVTS